MLMESVMSCTAYSLQVLVAETVNKLVHTLCSLLVLYLYTVVRNYHNHQLSL